MNHSVVYVKHNPYLVSFNCLIVLVNETEILQDLLLVHPCEQWTGSHSGSSNINQANSYFSSFSLFLFILLKHHTDGDGGGNSNHQDSNIYIF